MFSVAVTSLTTTVVTTALPTIVGEVGDASRYGWVFSSYLLAATTTVPIFSKLADMRGRKPIFYCGVAIFALGSLLCGLSHSMSQLIAFRVIQGIGAGAVQPLAATMIGDSFPPDLRARMQGYFSSVWGISAVSGPALGGLITSMLGWRWVFFFPVPICCIAIVLISISYVEQINRTKHKLDWFGMLTLTAAIVALLLAVNEVGVKEGFASIQFVALQILSILFFFAFILVERATEEPLIDFNLIRNPVIGSGLSARALAGLVMFGSQAFVPPMIQGVHGGTPLQAGLPVAAVSVGWPIASFMAGRWLVSQGSRGPLVAGSLSIVIGTSLLLLLGGMVELRHAVVVAMCGNFFVGLGMGLTATTVMVSIQSSVPVGRRGVATGLVQFSQTIGGALGIGLLGAFLAISLDSEAGASLFLGDSRDTIAVVALGQALSKIYLSFVAVGLFLVLLVWRWSPAVDVYGQPYAK